jgi:DNA-binding transcriptional MerR regulator
MQLTFLQEELSEAHKESAAARPKPSLNAPYAADLFGLPPVEPAEPKKKPRTKKAAPAPVEESAPVVQATTEEVHAATEPATEKSPTAMKTISEAAEILGVQQHVLRFWESRFSQIRPLKMRGGRRYYRPEDMEILLKVKHLLYKQGYTIKGAMRAFQTEKTPKPAPAPRSVVAHGSSIELTDKQRKQVGSILKELHGLREQLRPYLH